MFDVEEVPANVDCPLCVVAPGAGCGLSGEASFAALTSSAGLGIVAEIDDVLSQRAAVRGRVDRKSGV